MESTDKEDSALRRHLSILILVLICLANQAYSMSDAEWNRLPGIKALAVQISPTGQQVASPAFGYCYQQTSIQAARDCALQQCRQFAKNQPCVVGVENYTKVINSSLKKFRGAAVKDTIARLKETCVQYGITGEGDLNSCVQLLISQQSQTSQATLPPQQAPSRSYNWDALSQLGRDISTGKAWPKPPTAAPPPPQQRGSGCMKVSEYKVSNQKVCVYNCLDGQRTRNVSQYGMCPLI